MIWLIVLAIVELNWQKGLLREDLNICQDTIQKEKITITAILRALGQNTLTNLFFQERCVLVAVAS
mgnify:CR=1 FL=1